MKNTSNQMKIKFSIIFLFLAFQLLAQNPIPLQVSIPVYFEDVPYTHLQSRGLEPISDLCGIALLYIDTSITEKKILVAGNDDPVIWTDRVGITTKLSLISTDSNSNVSTLDFLYSNNICAISISRNDSIISIGNLTKKNDNYVIKIIGSNYWTEYIKNQFTTLNDHLMRLHTKQLKAIPISGYFNPDSLNVVLGYDYSFDTNYDLSWFDENLRNRIKLEADLAHDVLQNNLSSNDFSDTIRSNSIVVHTAQMSEEGNGINGKIATIFKMQGEDNYLFLKKKKEYLMEINYSYKKVSETSSKLLIELLSIKNMENGDFIVMEVIDMTDNGLPILYVDLISGVVMEDNGAWKADQFITAIQDVFRLVKLPGEG